MRTPFIAGNWKMNKTADEAVAFVREVRHALNQIEGVDVAFCPPFLAIPALADALKGTKIGVGAQNMFYEESGAFTGELAPNMLTPFCEYVILGHSERRAFFGETAQAANLVMATCNLGGSYLLWIDAREALENDVAAYEKLLDAEPGLVKLFRIGWNLLQHLPAQATNRMSQALSSPATMELLAARPWLIDEVKTLLHDPDIVGLAKNGDFLAVRETLKVLSVVLEPDAIGVLNLLIDDLPRLARGLEEHDTDNLTAAGARYITRMQDLFLLDRYLNQLHHQVKA